MFFSCKFWRVSNRLNHSNHMHRRCGRSDFALYLLCHYLTVCDLKGV